MSYFPAYAGSSPHTPERRRELRKTISSLAYIEIGSDNGGLIVDISENGLAVQAAMTLIGDRLAQVRFQLPGSQNWIEAGGRVAWKDKSKKQAGVEFVDLPEEARNQIRDWGSVEGDSGEAQDAGNRLHDVPEGYSGTGSDGGSAGRILGPVKTQSVEEGRGRDSVFAPGNLTPTPAGVESPNLVPELATIHSLIEKELLDSISTVHAATAPPVADESISPITEPAMTELSVEKAEADSISLAQPAKAPSVAEETAVPNPESAGSGLAAAKRNQDPLPEDGVVTSAGQEEAVPANSLPAVQISDGVKDSLTKPNRGIRSLLTSLAIPILRRWAVPVLSIAVIVACFVGGMTFRRRYFRTASAPDVASLPASVPIRGKPAEVGNSSAQPPLLRVKASSLVPEVKQSRRAPQNLPAEGQKAKTKLPAWTLSHPMITQHSEKTSSELQYSTSVVSQQENPSLPSQAMATLSSPPSFPTPLAPKPEVMQQAKHLDPAYLLFRVEPAYPIEAQQQGIEGTVKMHAIIGTDGKVKSLTLVSGPPLLVAAAMSAGREWNYLPAILNGQPVESEQDISIEFRLPR